LLYSTKQLTRTCSCVLQTWSCTGLLGSCTLCNGRYAWYSQGNDMLKHCPTIIDGCLLGGVVLLAHTGCQLMAGPKTCPSHSTPSAPVECWLHALSAALTARPRQVCNQSHYHRAFTRQQQYQLGSNAKAKPCALSGGVAVAKLCKAAVCESGEVLHHNAPMPPEMHQCRCFSKRP
jgi:hypothetical protein